MRDGPLNPRHPPGHPLQRVGYPVGDLKFVVLQVLVALCVLRAFSASSAAKSFLAFLARGTRLRVVASWRFNRPLSFPVYCCHYGPLVECERRHEPPMWCGARVAGTTRIYKGDVYTPVAKRGTVTLVTDVPRWRQVVADYVAMTKPKVMSLLLVTTLGAMLIAGEGFPSFWLNQRQYRCASDQFTMTTG